MSMVWVVTIILVHIMSMAGIYTLLTTGVEGCLILVTMAVGVLTMASEVSIAVTEDNINDNKKQSEQVVAHCQAVNESLSCGQGLGC